MFKLRSSRPNQDTFGFSIHSLEPFMQRWLEFFRPPVGIHYEEVKYFSNALMLACFHWSPNTSPRIISFEAYNNSYIRSKLWFLYEGTTGWVGETRPVLAQQHLDRSLSLRGIRWDLLRKAFQQLCVLWRGWMEIEKNECPPGLSFHRGLLQENLGPS